MNQKRREKAIFDQAARERRRERNRLALQTKKKLAGQRQAKAERHIDREDARKKLREEQMAIAEHRNMKPLTHSEQLDAWYAKNVVGRARELASAEQAIRDEEERKKRAAARPTGPAKYYFDKPSEMYKQKIDSVLRRITVGEADLSQVDWITANNTMVAAAKAGDVEGIIRLLQAEGGVAGVDFERADANGVSPLMWAAWRGHSEVLALLLGAKADCNRPSKSFTTPVYVAAQCGHLDCVEQLVSAGADCNRSRPDRSTPLHMATKKGHTEMVKLLVDLKALLDIETASGETALMAAVCNDKLACAQHILDAKANVDFTSSVSHQAAINIAARKGLSHCLRALVAAGASVNRPNYKDGTTPLCATAMRGHEESSRILLDAKADVDLGTKTDLTPCYLATQNDHSSIVELLISYGADVNKASTSGATPVFIGAQKGCRDSLRALIVVGKADVDKPRNDGITPHQVAERYGHTALLRCRLTQKRKAEPKPWAMTIY